MKRGIVPAAVGLARELAWSAALVKTHARRLNEYLPIRKAYDVALWESDHVACVTILNELEARFGHSLFAAEERIAILQVASGLQAQKSYSNRIIASLPQNDLVAFLAFYISERNEENTTASRFTARVHSLLLTWRLPNDFSTYLRFRLIGEVPPDTAGLESILRHEVTSAAIDHYETYITILAALAASDSALALEHMASLSNALDDERLRRASSFRDGELPTVVDDLSAWSQLLKGNWEHASALSRPRAMATGSRASLDVDVLSAVLAEKQPSETKTLAGSVRTSLAAIVIRRDDFEDHVDRLTKLRMNHSSAPFSAPLGMRIGAELTSEPIIPQKQLLEAYLLGPRPTTAEAIEVLGDLPTPASGSAPLATEYLNAMRGRRGSLSNVDEKALRHFAHLAAATMCYGTEDFDGTIAQATQLFDAAPYFRRLGARLTSKALLRLGRLGDAIDVIVSEALRDSRSLRMLPLAEAAAPLREKAIRRQVSSQISTPILLDLYAKHVDDALRKARQYSCDEYLRAHGLTRPHELEAVLGQLDVRAQYYLRFVCVPQNLQASPAFFGTKDVENERIQLCYTLASADPSNRETYIGEAVAIARDQTIREAMLRAEQSKVYVDETGLRAWADRELLESFSRYKALRKITLTKSQEAVFSSLRDQLRQKELGAGTLPALPLPRNEAVSILAEMAKEIARAALTSSDFGLDSYLGTRIRHGTLSGQLRSALVEHNLITQKRATNMPYSNNDYWWDCFSEQPWHVRESIMSRLNHFSELFDDLVDNFIKEQIQIVGPKKPAGLFASTISTEALEGVITAVTPETTLDQFVDSCLQAVLREAEASLEQVRDLIANVLKPTVSGLLSSLEDDVTRELAVANLEGGRSLFEWAVRSARNETMQLLDRVKNWFFLTRSTSEPTLTLDQLIETSVRTVETLHRDFKPRLVKRIPDVSFDGALTRFTDIFFQLIENVWQHSRFQGAPQIIIEATYSEETLKVRIESDIDASVRTSKVEKELIAIRAEIAGGDYKDATRTEGRSGLKKLFRSISQGQTRRPSLDLGFVAPNRFFVDFEFQIPLSKGHLDGDDPDH